MFHTDGKGWYCADGGAGSFVELNTSGFRVAELRFGDFNADGKTDVFGVVSGQWQVSYGGRTGWQPLRAKLTDSVAGLIVADFNGDGRADVAASDSLGAGVFGWQVPSSGTSGWSALRLAGVSLTAAAALGRFDANASADVLIWHDNYLDIAASGASAFVRHSRADLR